jgi:hypothetical protein
VDGPDTFTAPVPSERGFLRITVRRAHLHEEPAEEP